MKKQSDHRASLVVFCKRPALYQGKQRLAETIGAAQACAFAEAFLACALEDAMAWSGPVVLSPSSDADIEWAATLLTREHEVFAQPEGCLGQRLWTIDRQLRQRGADNIIFMGSDAPLLSDHHFEEAVQGLAESDIILSPASDGGVTLMGSRRGWPSLTDLPWSTDRLGEALGQLCQRAGYSVNYISSSYDIDVADDLRKLEQDLSGDPRSARRRLYGLLMKFMAEVKYG